MPEMRFAARWPSGAVVWYYSPSLVVHDYVAPGTAYAMDDFVERIRTAMTIASDRVEQKYGFVCSRAAATLAAVEAKAQEFRDLPLATVDLVEFEAIEASRGTMRTADRGTRP
jgi:uncharacterized repeat protein (TIGR04042 family)